MHGWDTLSVHAVGIKSAMTRSLRKRAKGGIKERREGSLNEGGVWAAVSPKEERREGFWYGDEGEDKSGLEAGKRRSAQCTRAASAARCRGHARTGC